MDADGESTVTLIGCRPQSVRVSACPCQPLHGSKTRSRVTMTCTGGPGRIVSVAEMLSWRWTIYWPVWLMLSEVPWRSARNVALLARRARFGANAQDGGERGGFEQFATVIVDTVLEAGIVFGIRAGLALQHDPGSKLRRKGNVLNRSPAAATSRPVGSGGRGATIRDWTS